MSRIKELFLDGLVIGLISLFVGLGAYAGMYHAAQEQMQATIQSFMQSGSVLVYEPIEGRKKGRSFLKIKYEWKTD
jgi:hypothetical protein